MLNNVYEYFTFRFDEKSPAIGISNYKNKLAYSNFLTIANIARLFDPAQIRNLDPKKLINLIPEESPLMKFKEALHTELPRYLAKTKDFVYQEASLVTKTNQIAQFWLKSTMLDEILTDSSPRHPVEDNFS